MKSMILNHLYDLTQEINPLKLAGLSVPIPEKLDCIIDTTPACLPVVNGLENRKARGRRTIEN
jgi:hypothetical protein